MIAPMLAQTYTAGQPLRFPVLIQPKLRGLRLICNGQPLSRNGNPLALHPDLLAELQSFARDVPLDGELYHPDVDPDEIIGICRSTVNPKDRIIPYHVFDIIDPDTPCEARLEMLRRLFIARPLHHIRLVPTWTADNAEQLEHLLLEAIRLGYEGIVIRDPAAFYHSQKTDALLKYKLFKDAEFDVTALIEGRGRLAGSLGALQCVTEDGHPFRVGTGFTDKQRAAIWSGAIPAIGRRVTIKFQELSRNGVPCSLSFLYFRDPE